MSAINERIKAVVAESGKTKTAFAKEINISQPYLSQMCAEGGKVPSDRTISDISRKFGVSELWLRTGEGEMHEPDVREREIEEFVGRALRDCKPSIQRRMLFVLARLRDDQWQLLADVAAQLYEEQKREEAEAAQDGAPQAQDA